MDYKISFGISIRDLEDAVNKLITEGWEPQGGPSAVTSGDYSKPWLFFQAMVKHPRPALTYTVSSNAGKAASLSPETDPTWCDPNWSCCPDGA